MGHGAGRGLGVPEICSRYKCREHGGQQGQGEVGSGKRFKQICPVAHGKGSNRGVSGSG